QFALRCPIHSIGRASPDAVTALSPMRKSSTATSPRWVNIRVPEQKQVASSVTCAASALLVFRSTPFWSMKYSPATPVPALEKSKPRNAPEPALSENSTQYRVPASRLMVDETGKSTKRAVALRLESETEPIVPSNVPGPDPPVSV